MEIELRVTRGLPRLSRVEHCFSWPIWVPRKKSRQLPLGIEAAAPERRHRAWEGWQALALNCCD